MFKLCHKSDVMKKIKWLLLFLLFTSCKESLLDFQDVEIDSFIKDNYQYDCMELYFREIVTDSTHFNYSDPFFDDTELNEIMAILQMIYDMDIPESDTVFN